MKLIPAAVILIIDGGLVLAGLHIASTPPMIPPQPVITIVAEDGPRIRRTTEQATNVEEVGRVRTLFGVRNRPPEAEAPAPVAIKASEALPRLVGILHSDSAAVAVIVSNGKQVRARPGTLVDGWSVQTINPRSVQVTQGSRNEILLIERAQK